MNPQRSGRDISWLPGYGRDRQYPQRGGYTPAAQRRREQLRLQTVERFGLLSMPIGELWISTPSPSLNVVRGVGSAANAVAPGLVGLDETRFGGRHRHPRSRPCGEKMLGAARKRGRQASPGVCPDRRVLTAVTTTHESSPNHER